MSPDYLGEQLKNITYLEMRFQLVKEINVYEKTKLAKDTKSTIQQSYLFERTAK